MTHVEASGNAQRGSASNSVIRQLPRAHAMVLAAGMAAFGIVAVAAAMMMTL
jgi:hypothetical protein